MQALFNKIKIALSFSLIICLSLLFSINSFSSTQKPHVHGAAYATLVTNQHTIQLNLNIPAGSVVGFEHIGKTQTEKKAIKASILILENSDLFTFFEKKAWFNKSQELSFVNAKTHADLVTAFQEHHGKHHHDDHHHTKKIETHSEFVAEFTYKLKKEIKLSKISTRLFSEFPALNTLDITVITPDSQKSYQLTAKDSSLILSK